MGKPWLAGHVRQHADQWVRNRTPATREDDIMTDLGDMFDGELIVGVPSVDWEYQRKAPGDADGDNQGDHCTA